ncbi:OmpA family protein [Algirhabdus cladophorae]|uniref:OmpA family protein n=1 Tax=Algirhabdus cladophorae TaxID=3377108 RepID=UPI003B847034
MLPRPSFSRISTALLFSGLLSTASFGQQAADKVDFSAILDGLQDTPAAIKVASTATQQSVAPTTAPHGAMSGPMTGKSHGHSVNAINSTIPCVAELAMVANRARVNFLSASADLTRNAKEGVLVLASMAQRCPQAGIIVEGYADPIGNGDYNLALSWRRANAVIETIKSGGFKTDRFEVHSHLTEHNDAMCQHFDVVDRRVEFIVVARING